MEEPFDEETPAERPVTSCPNCANEIDLTFCSIDDSVTCTVCGDEWIVVSLDPPELDADE